MGYPVSASWEGVFFPPFFLVGILAGWSEAGLVGFFPLYLHLDEHARSFDVPEYTMTIYVETENIYTHHHILFIMSLFFQCAPVF